jgi:hypothetical protein
MIMVQLVSFSTVENSVMMRQYRELNADARDLVVADSGSNAMSWMGGFLEGQSLNEGGVQEGTYHAVTIHLVSLDRTMDGILTHLTAPQRLCESK